MRLLVLDLDGEGCGVDLAIRAQNADHNVGYYLPPHAGGDERLYGKGMVQRIQDWEKEIGKADLTVLIGNSTARDRLAPYFGRGLPIFGTNDRSAALELDRGLGQRVLKEAGVDIIPYKIVDSSSEAIELICKTGKPYAMKPWGGTTDKSMTYVARSPDDAIFTLQRWEQQGLFEGQLMMQEKWDGVEVGIAGWFGPGGWCAAIEESFEHKKFMNDDKGENTGEMGTVIRHVRRSVLFDRILDPLTDYLHSVNYVGDCAVNCIVDRRGRIGPLEFTMRLGWPDFCIRQSLILGDPVEWMAELVNGRDAFEVSTDIAVGIAMTHGDFPRGGPGDTRPKDALDHWSGYPIYGLPSDPTTRVAWQQVMAGRYPTVRGKKVAMVTDVVTAGNFPMVAMGKGKTVTKAAEEAYGIADQLKLPSNLMYRTDIGNRLEDDLPELQKHGIAQGMKYG